MTQTVSVNTTPNAPKALKQTTLMLRKGQFVFEWHTTAVPLCPWQHWNISNLPVQKVIIF